MSLQNPSLERPAEHNLTTASTLFHLVSAGIISTALWTIIAVTIAF